MSYIHLPGDPQGRPPFLANDVLMQCGLVRCDRTLLRSLCDRTLNHVDRRVRFDTAAADHVLYASLYIDRFSSGHMEDKEFGAIHENDIGLWLPVWGGRVDALPTLHWTPAFIFVDSPSALITGREYYGYPKQLGDIVRHGPDEADFGALIEAIAFQQMDPSELATRHRVLTVEADPFRVADTTPFDDVMKVFAKALLGEATPPGGSRSVLPPFLGMPQVFLRQMRDVTTDDGAIVQEISRVSPAPRLQPRTGFAGLPSLTIHPLASLLIRETLGCQARSDLEAAFWARFDFELEVGERLGRA